MASHYVEILSARKVTESEMPGILVRVNSLLALVGQPDHSEEDEAELRFFLENEQVQQSLTAVMQAMALLQE